MDPVPAWQECARITIDLDAPLERWSSSFDAEARAATRALLDATTEHLSIPTSTAASTVHRMSGDRFRAEIEAFAAWLDLQPDVLATANASYDLVLASFGCSSAALATPRGPVLFRNMDWWPEHLLARASRLVQYRDGQGPRFASAGWPAASGIVTGASCHGFAVALNAVGCPESPDLDGYPVLLHVRRVLQDARCFQEAVEMLTSARLASAALFLVVGRSNEERIVVERSPSRADHRHPQGHEPLVVTNDYRALPERDPPVGGELQETACRRFDALTARAAALEARSPDDAELLDALHDPDVRMQITAQHVIARPSEAALRVYVPRRLLEG